MITVLLVEGHTSFREALAMALHAEGGFDVVADVGKPEKPVRRLP